MAQRVRRSALGPKWSFPQELLLGGRDALWGQGSGVSGRPLPAQCVGLALQPCALAVVQQDSEVSLAHSQRSYRRAPDCLVSAVLRRRITAQTLPF